jgi:hypothetical protein
MKSLEAGYILDRPDPQSGRSDGSFVYYATLTVLKYWYIRVQ